MLRCVIVDDNQSFLEAATRLLESEGVAVAAVASTASDAVATVVRERPEVVLVDIGLGLDSGFDVARRLAQSKVDAAVILISTHDEAEFTALIEESPAVGFVAKSDLSGAVVKQLVTGSRGT